MSRPSVRASRFSASAFAVAAAAATAALATCGGPTPAEGVTAVSSALNLSLPGRGSGLLWRTSAGDLHVWDMVSSTGYKDFMLGAPGTAWTPVATGDFNGDGAGDVFWREMPDLWASVWMLKDTQFASAPPAVTGAPNLTGKTFAGDLDGDGVSDLIWTGDIPNSPPAGPVHVAITWMMSPSAITPRSTSTVTSTTDAVLAMGNFDGDASRRADVLHQASNGNVSIALSGGATVALGSVGSGWVVKGVGDFNGDQTSDIVWYDNNSGTVSIWAMQNGNIISNPVPGGSAPSGGWTIQGIADVDHDGISDIVWRHSSGVVSIWMMSGPGTVREYGTGINVDPSTTFAGVVDLGPPPAPVDARVDSVKLQNGRTAINVMFSAQRPNEQVEAWENNGGTFTFRQRVPYAPFTGSTVSASLDSSLFQAGARACFELRIWEQGRVSYLGNQICAGGLPPPAAVLDWRVQDQFGLDADHDGAVDVIPSATTLTALKSGRFPITLDACGSNDLSAGGTITSYAWTIAGHPAGALTVNSTTCKKTGLADFPKGSFPATLTVTTQDGRTAVASRTITVNNTLVVSLGDSYASGEGDPVRTVIRTPANSNGSNNPAVTTPAFWGTAQDTACHRTANSGPARAALAMERADPHSSVTFLSVACSGAVVANLTDTPQVTDSGVVMPTQIQHVRNLLCPTGSDGTPANCPATQIPKIDALLLSISGNDVGFSDIIKTCVEDLSCSEDDDFTNGKEAQLNQVPAKMATLSGALRALNAAHTFITEYPDSVHRDSATLCYNIVLEGSLVDGTYGASLLVGKTDGVIGTMDLAWASGFIHRLDLSNQASAAAAGWTYVGGVIDAFYTHGYCLPDHWVVHYGESEINQDDRFGTLHPNMAGHNAYAAQILQSLAAIGLGPANAASFIPPGAVIWLPPI